MSILLLCLPPFFFIINPHPSFSSRPPSLPFFRPLHSISIHQPKISPFILFSYVIFLWEKISANQSSSAKPNLLNVSNDLGRIRPATTCSIIITGSADARFPFSMLEITTEEDGLCYKGCFLSNIFPWSDELRINM